MNIIPETLPSLVAAKDLKALLMSSVKFYDKFRIVEANAGLDTITLYRGGHIDRAVFVNTMECTKPSKIHPRPLPEPSCFRDYVGSLGISNKHHLIFYDRSPFGFFASSRLWWLFRYYGHEKVSILNGGLRLWLAANYELSTQHSDFARETFEISVNKALIRNLEDVKRNESAAPIEQLVDVRSARALDEQGRIPRSLNVPYDQMFDEERGGLKKKEELAKLFQASGVDLTKPIVASCMTGMTACTGAFAARLLGNDQTSLYPGSWTEFSQRD